MNTKNPAPLPLLDPLQRYTVEETIRFLRSSRFSVYRDIAAGRLVPIKEGKRTFIPGSQIAARCAAPVETCAA